MKNKVIVNLSSFIWAEFFWDILSEEKYDYTKYNLKLPLVNILFTVKK